MGSLGHSAISGYELARVGSEPKVDSQTINIIDPNELRVLTGRCRLNVHLYRIGVTNSVI